jgi:predicted DNA-binding protein (MmcQ/YjbR family)
MIMDFTALKNYCLGKKGAREDFPFDDETLVFKVGPKMFGLININKIPMRVSLKCDPYIAADLRSRYPSVVSAYHMNKAHWNMVEIHGSIPDEELLWMIDMSYSLVFKKLTGAQRKLIEENA